MQDTASTHDESWISTHLRIFHSYFCLLHFRIGASNVVSFIFAGKSNGELIYKIFENPSGIEARRGQLEKSGNVKRLLF